MRKIKWIFILVSIIVNTSAFSGEKIVKPTFSFILPKDWTKIKDSDDYLSFKKENGLIGITVDILKNGLNFEQFILSAIQGNEPRFTLVGKPEYFLIKRKKAAKFRMHTLVDGKVSSLSQTSIIEGVNIFSIMFICWEPDCEELKKEYSTVIDSFKTQK